MTTISSSSWWLGSWLNTPRQLGAQITREFAQLASGQRVEQINISRLIIAEGETDAALIFDRLHQRGEQAVMQMCCEAAARVASLFQTRQAAMDEAVQQIIDNALAEA